MSQQLYPEESVVCHLQLYFHWHLLKSHLQASFCGKTSLCMFYTHSNSPRAAFQATVCSGQQRISIVSFCTSGPALLTKQNHLFTCRGKWGKDQDKPAFWKINSFTKAPQDTTRHILRKPPFLQHTTEAFSPTLIYPSPVSSNTAIASISKSYSSEALEYSCWKSLQRLLHTTLANEKKSQCNATELKNLVLRDQG